MMKKLMILITILMLAGIMVSGCADTADDAGIDDEADVTASNNTEQFVTGDGQDYAVRMEYYGVMKPSELEINRGDTIAWRNYKPQGTYILVSDDGIFGDQEMDSNDVFDYTFTESGTYTFSVIYYPNMTLSVTVR